MLAAQAIVDDMEVVTLDAAFGALRAKVVW
jgi:predicted nucleic acid-binding protein